VEVKEYAHYYLPLHLLARITVFLRGLKASVKYQYIPKFQKIIELHTVITAKFYQEIGEFVIRPKHY
jgi:hypothetical protein